MSGTPLTDSGAGVAASWWAVLRRRWLSGLTVFLAMLALSAGVIFLSRPVYRSEARLRLGEPPPMAGVSPTGGILGLFGLRADPFANDLELLESRTVAEGVVADAVLNAHLRAPRGWHRDSIFQYLKASRGTGKAMFEAEWIPDGSVRVRMTVPRDSPIAEVPWGAAVSFGGLTAAFVPWRAGMPRTVRIRTEPFGESVRLTAERLRIERARRDANVVELAFDHTDPAVANAVVASLLRRFIGLRAAVQRRESGETVDSLRAVAEAMREELRGAEAELEALQRNTLIVAPEPQTQAFVERYSAAVADLERARIELAAISSALVRAASVETRAEAWTELLAHPQFLQNETLGGLLTQLTELETQRRDVAARRTEESREHRVLAEQIAYLEGALQSLARSYRTALIQQVARLEAQVATMDSVLAAVPAQAIELGRRTRAVRVLSEVLVLTEQRLRQEELREALTFANVQVIDPPVLRYRPVWPRKKLGLAVGFMLASLFGLLAMVVYERADTSVRRAAEVRAALGAPVLAVVTRDAQGEIAFAAEEAAALVWHAASDGRPAARLAITAVADEALARAVARGLEGAAGRAGENREPRRAAVDGVEIAVAAPVNSFAAAASAGRDGVPVTVIVEHARTRRGELERCAAWLAEAGARVAGAVVVCARPRDVNSIWE